MDIYKIPSHFSGVRCLTFINKTKIVNFEIGSHCNIKIYLLIKSNSNLNLIVKMTGKESLASIIILVKGNGNNNIMINTKQLHEICNTKSNLHIKTVLEESSHLTYNGLIQVEKNAQKTDAYQRSDTLILSDNCRASTSPVLEIEANDVKCTHGATIKPVTDEELWYLASRGINTDLGKILVARGFLYSAIGINEDIPEIKNFLNIN
jgi:Fe-S cluster assembly scaffold protein SufB